MAEKAIFPVLVLCRVLEVSRSGFYGWMRSEGRRSTRDESDAALTTKIAEAHTRSRGTYGSPRIHEELQAGGMHVGRNRVARLMKEQGLHGCRPRPFRTTTDSRHGEPIAPNLLERNFAPAGPDQVWASDITYVRTWEGWMYLAVVIDLWSRRVIGWSVADHMRTELVLGALEMAVGQRVPEPNLIHHSDRGSQYASGDYRGALTAHGILCSMSRKGDCWDNACVESFFATLKTELIHRRPWPTMQEARLAIHEFIGCFYNSQRTHSFLGYMAPTDFERRFEAEAAAAA